MAAHCFWAQRKKSTAADQYWQQRLPVLRREVAQLNPKLSDIEIAHAARRI
jgi:hypothetical protein